MVDLGGNSENQNLDTEAQAQRLENEKAKVAKFEFPPPQLIQATFSEGKTE